MIKKLLAGLCIFLAALFITQLGQAQEVSSPDSQISTQTPLPSATSSPFWEGLDGRASLKGGEITTSQGQFEYAQRVDIPVITTGNQYENITTGRLTLLEGANLKMKSGGVVPYVLPETKNFIVRLAFDYGQVGCGELVVTSALRVADSVMPEAASTHSVHPRGMAADVRVNGISEQCEVWLNEYFLTKEAEMVVDVTREHWKTVRGRRVPNPHFHIVVPVTQARQTVQVATNP